MDTVEGLRGRPGRADPQDKRQLEESPVSLRRVTRLFRPYRWQLAVILSLITASSAVSLASPFLLRTVIDVALPRQDVRILLLAVGGMLVVTVATAVLGVLQTWMSTTVGQRVMHTLRTDVFAHLQRQSLQFFTRTRGGEVQSRLTHDIGGMQSVVTSTATSIAANTTIVIGTAIAMVVLNWRLSLLSLLVLPPALWLTRKVARARREITAARQRHLAGMHGQVEEGLSVSGVLLGKTLGAGPAMSARFEETSNELVALEIRSRLAGRWRMATMSIVFAAIPALIYLAAGFPATSGGMTIGSLVAFTALQSGLFRPLMGLLDVGVEITSSMALFSRIFEYLDLGVEIDEPADPVRLDPARARGEVRFENVIFRYDDRPATANPATATADGGTADGAGTGDGVNGVNAVDGVSLTVPAGSALALVGETGSGKSTLAALVSRLHDPTSGRITIDGHDLRDLPLATLSALVGVVTQEAFLLHTTIRENLRYARPEASDDEIEAAARAAQIHDLIASLPAGYDTVVGARGHRFSGGEKQRIALARTLLRDPRVLVLDEATSALDNETERAVQAALDEVSRGRTTITIAHRLSTVRDADQIAVLDHGRVVELGDHDVLLARDGRYAALAAERVPFAA